MFRFARFSEQLSPDNIVFFNRLLPYDISLLFGEIQSLLFTRATNLVESWILLPDLTLLKLPGIVSREAWPW